MRRTDPGCHQSAERMRRGREGQPQDQEALQIAFGMNKCSEISTGEDCGKRDNSANAKREGSTGQLQQKSESCGRNSEDELPVSANSKASAHA